MLLRKQNTGAQNTTMSCTKRFLVSLILLSLAGPSYVCESERLTLRDAVAQVVVAMAGGGIIEFRFLDQEVNPLNWEIPRDMASIDQPYLRGHFLCLDRWGAPSESEAKHGVPFHGEAPRVFWRIVDQVHCVEGYQQATIACELPLARINVKRTLRLYKDEAFLVVQERVTNVGKLGRIYNMVQHPSIAPPFLDPATIIDSNAQYGFVQGGIVPESRETAYMWPNALIQGNVVDLRHFRNEDADLTYSDVSAFIFDDREKYGWVTACSPNSGLLLGYLWKTEDYPWLDIWRARSKGQVVARGLEFGTTGYHQPYAELVRTGRILDRPLYEYIDAGETVEKSYAAFLFKVPSDFQGIAEVAYRGGELKLTERPSPNSRQLSLPLGEIF